jgi:uncharacterized protein
MQRRLDLGKVKSATAQWVEIGTGQPDLEPIEVYLVRGTEDGPCCALISGVHGDEYDGIRATAEWAREIDPSRLRGTVVVIPVANPLAFRAAVRKTPEDGKDLNRVFPGNSGGTVTDRLADLITDGILADADLVLSLHGSSAVGVLMPWIEFLGVPGEVGRKTFDAAMASNFPDLIALPHLRGVLQTALAERDIPTIEGEVGGRGSTTRENVDYYKQRIADVLMHLGILPGTSKISAPKRVWWLDSIAVENSGIFIPTTELNADVVKGQSVGFILNGRGDKVGEVASPANGRIGGLREHAGITCGDRVATLWLPDESFNAGFYSNSSSRVKA